MTATLSATENVGNISWLHRKSGISFYLSEGMGLAWYTPTVTLTDGTVIVWKGWAIRRLEVTTILLKNWFFRLEQVLNFN